MQVLLIILTASENPAIIKRDNNPTVLGQNHSNLGQNHSNLGQGATVKGFLKKTWEISEISLFRIERFKIITSQYI